MKKKKSVKRLNKTVSHQTHMYKKFSLAQNLSKTNKISPQQLSLPINLNADDWTKKGSDLNKVNKIDYKMLILGSCFLAILLLQPSLR